MAQLVARLNGIQKARGSNPLVSTKNKKIALFKCDFLFFLAKPSGSVPTRLRVGCASSRLREPVSFVYKTKPDEPKANLSAVSVFSLIHFIFLISTICK